MAPDDGDVPAACAHPRRPYAKPEIIFSERYARGVRKDTQTATPEYHTTSTESTS